MSKYKIDVCEEIFDSLESAYYYIADHVTEQYIFEIYEISQGETYFYDEVHGLHDRDIYDLKEMADKIRAKAFKDTKNKTQYIMQIGCLQARLEEIEEAKTEPKEDIEEMRNILDVIYEEIEEISK